MSQKAQVMIQKRKKNKQSKNKNLNQNMINEEISSLNERIAEKVDEHNDIEAESLALRDELDKKMHWIMNHNVTLFKKICII